MHAKNEMTWEEMIEDEVSCDIPIGEYGKFQFTVLKEKNSENVHVILRKEPQTSEPVLVRIHSSCVTGDIFHSKRCDCYQQLHYSLKKIGESGGLLIYLSQEGRGIGLFNKIKAYVLQDQGYDTLEANEKLGLPIDMRSFELAARILQRHKINHIRLLTNNPDKVRDLKKYGIEHVEPVPTPAFCNENNLFYLQTKAKKLKHTINF